MNKKDFNGMRSTIVQIAMLLVLQSTLSGAALDETNSETSSHSFVAPLYVAPIYIGKPISRHVLEGVLEVEIGTPPQKIFAVLDTGSDTPVIYNRSCTMPDCGIAPKYDSSESSTAEVDFSRRVIRDYGAGNSSGYAAVDFFTFPTASPTVTFKDNFTAIDYVHWERNQAGAAKLPRSAGIYGVGPSPGLESTAQVLMTRFGIDMIAVTMQRGLPFTTGSVQFGGFDKVVNISAHKENEEEPFWTPSFSKYAFVIAIDDVLINGKSTGACTSSSPCGAMLDTGGGVMEFLNVGLNKSSSPPDLIDCKSIDLLPSFGIVVGKEAAGSNFINNGTTTAQATFTLDPQDYVLQVPDTNGTKCQSTISILTQTSRERERSTSWFDDLLISKTTEERSGGSRRSSQVNYHPFIHTESDFMTAINSSNHGGDVGGRRVMDFGIQWTSRITTIFDWKNNRVGLIQHD